MRRDVGKNTKIEYAYTYQYYQKDQIGEGMIKTNMYYIET